MKVTDFLLEDITATPSVLIAKSVVTKMLNLDKEYERLLTLQDAILTQEMNLLVSALKQKCTQLYQVRRRLCQGSTVGELKTVVSKIPNKLLGNTYQLYFYRNSASDNRRGAFVTRWRKGKNGLPDKRLLIHFLKDCERHVVVSVLNDLVCLNERLQLVQDTLWSLRSGRERAFDAFTISPEMREAELQQKRTTNGSL